MSVQCQYTLCMLTQTLYKNGNSVAVTIPRQYLEDLGLKEGSEVVVEKQGKELRITSKKYTLAQDVDPKFMKMIDEFVAGHEDVLQKLANK
jgi:putative addiction module antidote